MHPIRKTWWFLLYPGAGGSRIVYWLDKQRVNRLVALQNVLYNDRRQPARRSEYHPQQYQPAGQMARIKADKGRLTGQKEFIEQIQPEEP